VGEEGERRRGINRGPQALLGRVSSDRYSGKSGAIQEKLTLTGSDWRYVLITLLSRSLSTAPAHGTGSAMRERADQLLRVHSSHALASGDRVNSFTPSSPTK
jgi:hypothetical protein